MIDEVKFYTYVLISENGKRTYTGHTANLQKRLDEHNRGEVLGSRLFRPYKILHFEEFSTLKEAKQREMYYKNYRGRQRIKLLFGENIMRI